MQGDSDKNQERVLICAGHPAHAAILIAHGARLVGSFQQACGLVLYVHQEPLDDHRWSDMHAMALFRSLCERRALPFEDIACGRLGVAETIRRIVEERGITKVVLGESPMGRFNALFHASLSNQLLRLHLPADIQIVDVSACQDVDENLEFGFDAWLVKDAENKWKMTTERQDETGLKGIFFRDAYTEFDHGFFVRTDCEPPEVLEIADAAPVTPPQH